MAEHPSERWVHNGCSADTLRMQHTSLGGGKCAKFFHFLPQRRSLGMIPEKGKSRESA